MRRDHGIPPPWRIELADSTRGHQVTPLQAALLRRPWGCVSDVCPVLQFRQESEFWEAPQVDDLFVSFVGLEVLVSNLEFHRFHLVQSHQTWAS